MPAATVLNLVENWANKHRIKSVSEWAKADLASMIDAFAREKAVSGESENNDRQSDWDLPV